MKRLTLLSILLVLATSCSDFLERTAQNLVVPTTVDQYKEMLQGPDGYLQNIQSSILWVNHMTDDISYFDVSDRVSGTNLQESHSLQTYRFIYQWADEIEENFSDNNFAYLYSQVLVANTVLDAIDGLKDLNGERELLRGQALFTRALAYFYLAGFYGQAYNESTDADLCVPLKLDPTPSTEKFGRATVYQVWKQIRDDLAAAAKCMEAYKVPNIYEVDMQAALFLSMRTALFMEDYDAAIEFGERLLSSNAKLFDITGKTQAITGNESVTGGPDLKNFISKENDEILWLYGAFYRQSAVGGLADNHVYYYALSDSLIDAYSEDLHPGEKDHRLCYFFVEPGRVKTAASSFYNYSLLKFDANDMEYRRMHAFRNGEIYLTLAECWARKDNPDVSKALYYLNTLRKHRISQYVELASSDFSDTDALVSMIWRERRRELVGEECHRWWDLRRTGQPAIVHEWAINGFKTPVEYRLEDHDPAYVLNFPASEREQNPENYNERPYRTYVKK